MQKSIPVEAGTDYQGEIPEGAVRLILTMGEQGRGEVVIGSADPQPLFYGKNEYVLNESNTTSYTIKSEKPLSVVESFVFMPETVDAYLEQKFNMLIGPFKTQLDNHEERITALEEAPGPPVVPTRENPNAVTGKMSSKEPGDEFAKRKK